MSFPLQSPEDINLQLFPSLPLQHRSQADSQSRQRRRDRILIKQDKSLPRKKFTTAFSRHFFLSSVGCISPLLLAVGGDIGEINAGQSVRSRIQGAKEEGETVSPPRSRGGKGGEGGFFTTLNQRGKKEGGELPKVQKIDMGKSHNVCCYDEIEGLR